MSCCPLNLETSVMERVLAAHCKELGLEPGTTTDQLMNNFVYLSVDFLAKFRNLYNHY